MGNIKEELEIYYDEYKIQEGILILYLDGVETKRFGICQAVKLFLDSLEFKKVEKEKSLLEACTDGDEKAQDDWVKKAKSGKVMRIM